MIRSTLRAFTVLAFFAFAVPAQQDPSREIQELARRIEEQMQEIDRLLLESSKPAGDRQKSPKELLDKSQAESHSVQQAIDELIQKLNQMKQQGGQGSGQPDDQQQGQQGGQQQQQQGQQDQQDQQGQGKGNRREGTNPDFMKQPDQQGQQPGDQQQQQQGQQQQGQGKRPQAGDPNPADGENRSGQNPPDSGTAKGAPGTGEDEWGGLQPYVNFLKNRGSPPKVQEKYRKFWETYLKARPDKKQ